MTYYNTLIEVAEDSPASRGAAATSTRWQEDEGADRV